MNIFYNRVKLSSSLTLLLQAFTISSNSALAYFWIIYIYYKKSIPFKNLFSDSNLFWIQAQLHLLSTPTKCCLRHLAHKHRRLNWRKIKESHLPDCQNFIYKKKILSFLQQNSSWQSMSTNTWAGLWTEYTKPLVTCNYFLPLVSRVVSLNKWYTSWRCSLHDHFSCVASVSQCWFGQDLLHFIWKLMGYISQTVTLWAKALTEVLLQYKLDCIRRKPSLNIREYWETHISIKAH